MVFTDVQGGSAVGTALTGNPIPIGAADANGLVQWFNIDSAGGVVTNPEVLTWQDDVAGLIRGATYQTAATGTVSGTPSTLTMNLPTVLLGQSTTPPAVQDAATVILWLENKLGVAINGLIVSFIDTIGTTPSSIPYAAPVSLANNAVSRVVIPVTRHLLHGTPTLKVTSASPMTNGGTLKVTAVYSGLALGLDSTWRFLPPTPTAPTTLTDNAAHSVAAAPGVGLRLWITNIVAVNASTTVPTEIVFTDNVTGNVVALGGCPVNCAPFIWQGPPAVGIGIPGVPLSQNSGLDATCLVTGAHVDVVPSGYIGPI